MTEAYDVYKIFIAVKQHFNNDSDYDYFKYNGNIRTSKPTFLKRKDKGVYFHLLKKYKGDLESIRNHLFLSIMYDNTGSISKYTKTDNFNMYQRYLGEYVEEPTKRFKEDFGYFNMRWHTVEGTDLPGVISCSEGIPLLFMEVFSMKVTPVIPYFLNKVLPVFDHWKGYEDVFHPFMTDKLQRLFAMNQLFDEVFQGLTKKDISSIMKGILEEGE